MKVILALFVASFLVTVIFCLAVIIKAIFTIGIIFLIILIIFYLIGWMS